MGSPAKLNSFCHMCMSPTPHHHDHPHVEYSRCLEMRMNVTDYSASRSSSVYDSPEVCYPGSPFAGSPQSRSSCMYSLHGNSPSVIHPLAFRSSAEHFMSPSKENGLYHDIPPQCRRRLDFNHNDYMGLSKAVPVTVAKRNERERNRVKLINTTFQTLRQHLPVQSRGAKGQAKKLSKVQTLRSAIDYIRNLEDLIEDRKQGKQSQQQIDEKLLISSSDIKEEIFKEDEMMDDEQEFEDLDETEFSEEAKQYSTINNNLPESADSEKTMMKLSALNDSNNLYGSNNVSLCHTNNNEITHNNNNNSNSIINNNNNNNNSNSQLPEEQQVFHGDQQNYYHHHHHHHHNQHHHNPRAYYHQKSHRYLDGRAISEGVGHPHNSSSALRRVPKCHSEEGSASPVDSDRSGDITTTEEDEVFDFDLWFWTD